MQINGRGRLGDTTTTTTTPPVASPGFIQGAELWETPGAAFTAAQGIITNYSTSFTGSSLMYNLGVLAVPIGLVLLVFSMGGHRR